ncbi:uncharacterized protein JCM15063_001591 [Sporobolomyces koalae]|uniref:uncharacterized protein n=1 Tax=Sporobolomyces koalae TaxID=500713 RepID=UPI00317A9B94
MGTSDRADEVDNSTISTPKGKSLFGDNQDTLKRPRTDDTSLSLAPALPVSPSSSDSARSSPSTSPSRARRGKTAAKQQRVRNYGTGELEIASHRTSRSTLASFSSTGDSVYEDAVEPDSDEAEEVLSELDHTEGPIVLPPLESSELPDTPPELDIAGQGSRSRQITPRPTQQSPSATMLASPIPLSPEAVARLDEHTLYQQRQVELQAEARKNRGTPRRSISSLPTSPQDRLPASFRRHSGMIVLATAPPSHPRRASISLASSPPVSGNRQWHPKPLVLTPARTVSTPLTTDSSLLTSPKRHMLTYEGSLDGHLRTHSRGSSYHDGTIRTVTPLSPSAYSASSRSVSPFQSSPRRLSGSSGNPKRRSLGYVGSQADLLSSFGKRAIGLGHRPRSASEDTGVTRLTIDSTISRFTADGETPASSSSGWSDEVKTNRSSPQLDDKEWDQQWQMNRSNGTPLEMVAEVSVGDIHQNDLPDRALEEQSVSSKPDMREEPLRFSQDGASIAPKVRCRAATDDRTSVGSSGSEPVSFVEPVLATPRTLSAAAMLRRGSVPPTPPPRLPLPRTPSSTDDAKSAPKKRTRPEYEERRNSDRPSFDSTAPREDTSNMPKSPKKTTASPRRPIVIPSTTPRSAAALARRTARLSLTDPPVRPPIPEKFDASIPNDPNQHDARSRTSSYASRSSIAPPSQDGDVRVKQPLSPLLESCAPIGSPSLSQYQPDSQRSVSRTSRAPSRASHMSPRISIGSTFANGFGATRRVDFEPRDPRTREELDAGQGSYLEVLLYSEPPPRPERRSTRWSTMSAATSATSSTKDAAPSPFIRSDSPTTNSQDKSGHTFAHRLFSGFRGKSSSDKDRRSYQSKSRPSSLASQTMPRSAQPRPRPIVSGPLELENAELARTLQARASRQFSSSANTSNLTVSFAAPIPVMKSYTSLARAYEEEEEVAPVDPNQSLSHSQSHASLDTVDRPAPRAFALPPGLVRTNDDDSPPPPPPPFKPPRSPLRPVYNSEVELLHPPSARAVSPVLSFKSFPSPNMSFESSSVRTDYSRARSSSMGRNSSSEPIGVRDVLRGQFLER